jgi:hypothetical protein
LGKGSVRADLFTLGAIVGVAEVVDVQERSRSLEANPWATGPYCLVLDKGQDRRLGGGWDLPPKVFRDGQLLPHAAELRGTTQVGKVGP